MNARRHRRNPTLCSVSDERTNALRIGIVALLLFGAGLIAQARQIQIQDLPRSNYLDTEVVTNMNLHIDRFDMREMELCIQLNGTATNDLEVSFGVDVDKNGVLDVSEIETSYGWRAGKYLVENVSGWERLEEASTNKMCRGMSLFLGTGLDGVCNRFRVTCEGRAAFTGLSTKPIEPWLFRKRWDMLRIVRRGVGCTNELIRCEIDYNHFIMRIQ
jgi:hypothetical protein